MANELTIIPSAMLTDISVGDINAVITKMVADSKENFEELSELTLECTSLLASAESKSTALSEQGIFKRLIGGITGKNDKLRDAILKDNTNALYAAQQVINCVMHECTNNRKLFLAVNDRISDVYLDLKVNQNEIASSVLMVRKAIVAFYSQYKEELLEQEKRISSIENCLKEQCQSCHAKIPIWETVCPYCGNIHSLKNKELSPEAYRTLEKLSDVVKDKSDYEDIIWSEIAKKKARVLRKIKLMGELGRLPGYTEEIIRDIDDLINKCKHEEFQIAIVGVVKAGKSYLMNALIGKEIASVNVIPETAVLTKFRAAYENYVKVQFYKTKEWKKFRKSVEQSKKKLKELIATPEVHKLEEEYVNHEDIYIECKDLEELRSMVKNYTSADSAEHLFVSEVEVGIAMDVFHMPKEVVFVDTPGLHDPVKYRADITKKYINRADALLIAVPIKSQSEEAYEIITKALECTDKNKSFIIATQIDAVKKDECDTCISPWIENLVEGGFYSNEKEALRRVIKTSAKMELLLEKWISIDDDKRNDKSYFSNDDYDDLEAYVKKVLDLRKYDIDNLPYNESDIKSIKSDDGIDKLRKKLDETLIKKHKALKISGIEDTYNRCKLRLNMICNSAIRNEQNTISFVEKSVEELNYQLQLAKNEKSSVEQTNQEIQNSANQLRIEINNVISLLERKGY